MNCIAAQQHSSSTRGGSPWLLAALGILAGVLGIGLAFAPWGPLGAVAGAAGVAVGVISLLRDRQTAAHPLPSVIALVSSGLAVVLTLVLLLTDRSETTPAAAPGQPNACATTTFAGIPMDKNPAEVLGKDLDVEFGSPGASGVSMTITNRRDTAMQYYLTVVGQTASGSETAKDPAAGALMAPLASQTKDILQGESNLDGLTFKVSEIKSAPFASVPCG